MKKTASSFILISLCLVALFSSFSCRFYYSYSHPSWNKGEKRLIETDLETLIKATDMTIEEMGYKIHPEKRFDYKGYGCIAYTGGYWEQIGNSDLAFTRANVFRITAQPIENGYIQLAVKRQSLGQLGHTGFDRRIADKFLAAILNNNQKLKKERMSDSYQDKSSK